jgi:hypothetical protein
MAHSGVIWIISLKSVPVVSTIDDGEVIYPCLFAFNFLGNILVLFSTWFNLVIKREIALVDDVCSKPPIY